MDKDLGTKVARLTRLVGNKTWGTVRHPMCETIVDKETGRLIEHEPFDPVRLRDLPRNIRRSVRWFYLALRESRIYAGPSYINWKTGEVSRDSSYKGKDGFSEFR